MWEQILIGVIVVLAALYVLLSLRRALTGKTACQEEMCIGCALRKECAQAPQEPEAQSEDSEETTND